MESKLNCSIGYRMKDFSSNWVQTQKIPTYSYSYYLLIKSYLKNCTFFIHINNSYSVNFPILAGVPQRSDIVPFLYSIFLSWHYNFFTYNTGQLRRRHDNLVSNNDPLIVSQCLQSRLNSVWLWSNLWKIKINELKSSFITFSPRPRHCLLFCSIITRFSFPWQ